MTNLRGLRVVCLAALAVWAGFGQPARGQRFEGEASVVVVEVPVQVVRDGRPVRGLSADDFEIRDGGKKVPIVGFEAIDLAELGRAPERSAAPVPVLPISARRHFLLLFDLSFSDPSSVARARQAADDLVAEGLQPSDLVAVAAYSASRGVEIPLGFTSDRNQLRQALARLASAEPYAGFADPLGIVIGELDADLASRRTPGGAYGISSGSRGGGAAAGSVGLNPSAMYLENARDLEPLGERAVRDQQENRIAALSSSLSALAELLRGVTGRVHIVLLSEGFDSAVILGNEGTRIEDQARAAEISEYQMSGQYWRVDTDARHGSAGARSALFEMLDRVKRANGTIQAVDIGGLRAGNDLETGTQGQNGLFIMANETGGELYRNTNDLSEAMGRMLERTSVTYVLAFEPRELAMDGRYHSLEVRLKGQAKGARAVHRPGYYEPRPFGERSREERRLAAAGLVQGGERGGRLGLTLLSGAFDHGGDKAWVPVFLEIDGDTLEYDPGWPQLPLEIYVYAFDEQGTVRDFFAQAVAIDIASSSMLLRHSGYKFWGQFDLAPGRYLVRALVRNAATGSTGVELQALEVREPGAGDLALLPPFVPDPEGWWVLGREQEKEPRRIPYPYLVQNRPVMPAARPAFWAGRRSEVRLMGYNLGEGEVAVEGRLVTGEGEPVPGASLELTGRQPGALPGLSQLVATLDPAGAAPGDCSLIVTVRRQDEPQAGSVAIPCRIR